MITTREPKPKELDEIKELNKRIFVKNPTYDNDTIPDFAHTERGDEYFKKAIGNKEGIFFLAIEDGYMVGYVNGENKVIQHRISRYFEIDNLGVVPEKK